MAVVGSCLTDRKGATDELPYRLWGRLAGIFDALLDLHLAQRPAQVQGAEGAAYALKLPGA